MGSTPILSSMAIVALYAVIAVFVLFSLWAGWDSGYDAGWLDGNLNRSRTYLQVMDEEVEQCAHCCCELEDSDINTCPHGRLCPSCGFWPFCS